MSDVMMVNVIKTVTAFMINKGWQEHVCNSCGRTFFLRPSSNMNKQVCGWRKCGEGLSPFHAFSRSKKMVTPAQANSKITGYFISTGFRLVEPLNIANMQGCTDLVVAGVQMFDGVIHDNQEINEERVFVAQPCVRMQFQPLVESQEGTSTSFVNVCTEKMSVTIDEHLNFVDHWCTALSKLSLHMNDFVFILRTSTADWGTGEFAALGIFFVYAGLELGDASYAVVPRKNHTPVSISDIGFGLERIVWAMNKTGSYFETLIPWTAEGTNELFDTCRTLMLLAVCGVCAGNKGANLQFRRFAKILSEKYCAVNMESILRYYFSYWSQFIKPILGQEESVELVQLEIERFINLKVSEMQQLPPPRGETTEAYFDRLVYAHNIDSYKLRKALQNAKHKEE